MNTIERDQDNKARRRVVTLLAGGIAGVIALGLIGVGIDLTADHPVNVSASSSHAVH